MFEPWSLVCGDIARMIRFLGAPSVLGGVRAKLAIPKPVEMGTGASRERFMYRFGEAKMSHRRTLV